MTANKRELVSSVNKKLKELKEYFYYNLDMFIDYFDFDPRNYEGMYQGLCDYHYNELATETDNGFYVVDKNIFTMEDSNYNFDKVVTNIINEAEKDNWDNLKFEIKDGEINVTGEGAEGFLESVDSYILTGFTSTKNNKSFTYEQVELLYREVLDMDDLVMRDREGIC